MTMYWDFLSACGSMQILNGLKGGSGLAIC